RRLRIQVFLHSRLSGGERRVGLEQNDQGHDRQPDRERIAPQAAQRRTNQKYPRRTGHQDRPPDRRQISRSHGHPRHQPPAPLPVTPRQPRNRPLLSHPATPDFLRFVRAIFLSPSFFAPSPNHRASAL